MKHLLVVITTPVAGQEDDYNRWYTNQHLPDVLRVPGFTGAQRFKVATHGPNGLPGSYMAIYEYETTGPQDDPRAAFSRLADATKAGQMWISPAMDSANLAASLFTPITEKLFQAQ